MDFNFKEGFKFFEKNCSSFLGSNSGAEYIEKIEKEIEELENNINSFKGFSTEATILKGDIAEFMHAGTFNINAAMKSSTSRAKVDRSHDFASVDIQQILEKIMDLSIILQQKQVQKLNQLLMSKHLKNIKQRVVN